MRSGAIKSGSRLLAKHLLLASRTVRRLPLYIAAVFLLGTTLPWPHEAHGMTDDEKKKAFIAARDHGSSDDSDATPTPKPKTKKHSAKAKAKPKSQKPKPKPSPHKRKTKTHAEATPKPHPKPEPEESATPAHKPEATPQPTPAPKPSVSPSPKPSLVLSQSTSVTIEKSGITEEETPTPSPTPEEHSWLWHLFHGTPVHYKYLTKEVRAAIDKAPVARSRWRYIVVHNSGTRQGNAKAFDYYHRNVRKMPNGLAYHFVIGNGTSSGNGQVEIGPRWVRQINGGHVHSDYLNNIALGICLVGDFNRDVPTPEQQEALDELIRYLRNRVGKIEHKPAIVKAHKDINPPQWPTDCPGNRFPYRWLYTRFD